MTKFTKLSVFDFDGTLINTPLPEAGRLIYFQKTGKEWPHKGWWSKRESLDTSVFEMATIPSVIADYEHEKTDETIGLVLLTGRMEDLAALVKGILDEKGLSFHEYHYNTGGPTEVAKIRTLDSLLTQYPDVEAIEVWEDRMEHLPIFEAWGKKNCESGRIKDFKINLVISNHH
jgi:FMN phosphatase YigB (HAD superfamily)